FLKVTKRNSKGVPGKVKLVIQMILGLLVCMWIQTLMPTSLATHVTIPFFKHMVLNIGGFYLIFAIVVIVGASNAVNLTDGLDGLAIMPIAIAAACFALISYLVGHSEFAHYLQIPHVAGTGEIAVICAALVGAALGFLWFNAPPAQIFMGDVGSLALGGVIGTISVITKHEMVLGIIGGLFVIEA
ncbi:MAG: phospho-N-acetylmuramoyl-pentapeptide-transferase, partial [Aquificaceae bacterium]